MNRNLKQKQQLERMPTQILESVTDFHQTEHGHFNMLRNNLGDKIDRSNDTLLHSVECQTSFRSSICKLRKVTHACRSLQIVLSPHPQDSKDTGADTCLFNIYIYIIFVYVKN